MPSTDPALGERVHAFLLKHHLESPMQKHNSLEGATAKIRQSVADILEALGVDLEDESMEGTPARVGRMFVNDLFYGLDYTNFPKCTTTPNDVLQCKDLSMRTDFVYVGDCRVSSTCEHHLVPITGVAHIAYIPHRRVLGLSKINRICEFFCRRPQIQERLTHQIRVALQYVAQTYHVAVYLEAAHGCVQTRGIRDPFSQTATISMGGIFSKKAHPCRREFLQRASPQCNRR